MKYMDETVVQAGLSRNFKGAGSCADRKRTRETGFWRRRIAAQRPPSAPPEIPNVPAPQPEIPEPVQPEPELPEPPPDPGIPPPPKGPQIDPDSSPTIEPPERRALQQNGGAP